MHFKKQVQEWKDTLLRDNDPASRKKYRRAFQDEETTTQNGFSALRVVVPQLNLSTVDVTTIVEKHAVRAQQTAG